MSADNQQERLESYRLKMSDLIPIKGWWNYMTRTRIPSLSRVCLLTGYNLGLVLDIFALAIKGAEGIEKLIK